jgi:hypothetical protein
VLVSWFSNLGNQLGSSIKNLFFEKVFARNIFPKAELNFSPILPMGVTY